MDLVIGRIAYIHSLNAENSDKNASVVFHIGNAITVEFITVDMNVDDKGVCMFRYAHI